MGDAILVIMIQRVCEMREKVPFCLLYLYLMRFFFHACNACIHFFIITLKGVLMDGTAKAHQGEYGVQPGVLVEVPQVTTLLGAFSEYCGGYALMSTNDHGLRVALSKREDNTVKVFNASKGERKKFQLSALKERKEDKWASIVKAVCQVLLSAEIPISGFDMTFKGQSAVADAPSITAAIVSGMIFGLNSLYSLFCDLESYDYHSYEYPFVSESGIGSYFIDCALPEDELSSEVEIFREQCIKAAKLTKEAIGAGEKLKGLTERGIRHLHLPLAEDLKRTISFVVEDSAFACKGLDAINAKDATAFGKIFTAEQRNISELADLTSPEVDWLVKRGIEASGVKGVTEISVGISGTLVALIEKDAVDQYRAQLEEYERIFGFHPIMREYVPSGGLREISEDEYSSL